MKLKRSRKSQKEESEFLSMYLVKLNLFTNTAITHMF